MWDSNTGPNGPVAIRSSHEQKKDRETKKAETAWGWHGTYSPTGVAETSTVIGNGGRETCSQTETSGLVRALIVVIRVLLIMTS